MRLNDGLERIGEDCFMGCGLERVFISSTAEHIHDGTANNSNPMQPRLLGTAEKE